MGSKQLLLIVLGVFIVGVSVFVSVAIFDSQFSGQVKDMAIQQMHDISSYAVTYWKKPEDSGGGGGTYYGFEIPKGITEGESNWNFDMRLNNSKLDFFMISKEFKYNGQSYILQGLHDNGKFVFLKLFNPEKNEWETLFDNT